MINTKIIIRSFIKRGIYMLILVVFVVGVTFGISYLLRTYPPEVQAAEAEVRVGQVHMQQESVKKFYEETFPDGPSIIIPSASDAVQVSVTVLDNLSLSVADGQPKYATNWIYGATMYHVNTNSNIINVIIYTVTADY